MSLIRLPNKHKFGSTPMFNDHPYLANGSGNDNLPPSVTTSTFVPNSFSCNEVKRFANKRNNNLSEGFYAATDIFDVSFLSLSLLIPHSYVSE